MKKLISKTIFLSFRSINHQVNNNPFNHFIHNIYNYSSIKPQQSFPLSKSKNQYKINQLPSISQKYIEITSKYPFTTLPRFQLISLQRVPELTQDAKALLAWSCLVLNNKKQFEIIYDILFPENSHLKFTQGTFKQSGREIFSQYFQKRLNPLILKINEPGITHDELISCLNTLIYMKYSPILVGEIQNIKKSIIQRKDNQIILTMITHLRIVNRLSFQEYLPVVQHFLQDQSKQKYDKVNVAYILANVPYFYKYYDRELVKSIFSVFKNNLSEMDNQKIYKIIKAVYQNNSKYAINFVQALIKFIISVQPNKNSEKIDFLLEIIVKTISLSIVIQVPFQHLIFHLIENSSQYQAVIQQNRLSHAQFRSIILSQCKKNRIVLSNKLITKVNEIIKQWLKELQIKQSIDQIEFINFVKLSQKFKKQIESQLFQNIRSFVITVTYNSPQIQSATIYDSLSLILAEKNKIEESENQKNIEQQQKIKDLITKYFKNSCQLKQGELLIVSNINQCINLISKIYQTKLNIQHDQLPKIFKFNFKNKNYSMNIHSFQNLIRYLFDLRQEKTNQIKEIFRQIEPITYTFFNKKQVNFRTTMNILQLASSTNFQNSNMYRKIEKSIYQILQKFSQFKITSHDLHIIKSCLLKKGFAGRSMIQFVNSAIQKPMLWSQLRQQYLKNEQKFQEIQRNRKKQSKYNKIR